MSIYTSIFTGSQIDELLGKVEDSTSDSISDKIVLRDESGNFSSNSVTLNELILNGYLSVQANSTASSATHIPVFISDPASTTRTVVTRTPNELLIDIGAESSFAKGNLVEGNRVTLTGTLTNRLVESGDITISADPTDISQGTRTETTVLITSSTGTGATLDVATTSLAGIMSSADKTKLDGIAEGAEVNQNSFSNIAVSGQTTISADGKEDTLTFIAGTNISITTDATNDTITINADDTSVDWSEIQNKPNPVITLDGDLTGSVTLTDLQSGTLTATIAANSVDLGTDTTGNYMIDVSAGGGISVSHTPGEGSTATISHSDTSSVVNLSSNNSSGTVIQDISFSFDTYGHVTDASVGTVNLDDRYYTETESDTRFINVEGDTMTGFLTLHSDPTNSLHATTKQYVDNLAQGLRALPSAKAATTENLSAAYDNGVNGVDATLTSTINESFPTIDGVSTWNIGDNILVKNQTNSAQNGSYVITDLGSASTPWIIKRCGFCDEPDEIEGAYEFVTLGSVNGSTGWVLSVSSIPVVIGTTQLNWIQFSGAGTYTAGTGLTLSGTQFSHGDTSSVVSVDNSANTNTFIQNLTFDGFGHVTAVSSATVSIATSTVLGGVKLGSDTIQSDGANSVTNTTGRSYALQVNSDGQGVINVPWTDTTYSEATTTVSGLMSSSDKIKLDEFEGGGEFTLSGSCGTIYSSEAGCCSTGVNNFFAGFEAGKCNTTGCNNNFFGRAAGCSNTTGSYNNFIGRDAGRNNTTGFDNNFFGRDAGLCNTTGSFNNFFGNSAGLCNTTGSYNNFIGRDAGRYNTTGSYNIFIGNLTGFFNTSGSYNNFFGRDAGYCNTSGSDNNFIGHAAGLCNTTGSNNNFIGRDAGRYNSTGSNNNFFGPFAGRNNTTGSNNLFFGCNSGCEVTTGTSNTIIGSIFGTSSLTNTAILAAGTCERVRVDDAGMTINGGPYSVSILKSTTTTNTATVLTTDGAAASDTNQIILPNDSTYAFRTLIAARRTDADGESAGYEFLGVIDRNNNAASTSIVGAVSKTVIAEDNVSWDVSVTADTTNGGIKIEVTGEAAKTISWVATTWTTRVTG